MYSKKNIKNTLHNITSHWRNMILICKSKCIMKNLAQFAVWQKSLLKNIMCFNYDIFFYFLRLLEGFFITLNEEFLFHLFNEWKFLNCKTWTLHFMVRIGNICKNLHKLYMFIHGNTFCVFLSSIKKSMLYVAGIPVFVLYHWLDPRVLQLVL